MEDLLNMPMDSIADIPETVVLRNVDRRKNQGIVREVIDPLDHFEVECSRVKTIFVGGEEEARVVFTESQSQAKALIRLYGSHRIVIETNAPYLYLRGKLEELPNANSNLEE